MAEQKKAPSTNGEFKTSPLGFDKAEVMAYIVQHNKERKALKEENEELKRALEEKQQTNEGQNNELTAELEKKKAELDAQILESRKQILDERRKLAQTEKELHVMQDKYSALTEEFAEFKKQAAAKIDKAKHSGGTIDPAQLAEISAKANADANAVINDAQSKANEIITAAKAYFADTVKKTYDYKQSVLEKADTFANGVTSGAAAHAIDIQAVLAGITASVNEAVEKALAGANAVNDAVAKAVEDTKAVNDVLAKAVEEASQAETATDNAADVPEEKLSDDEELINAKSELENIGGLDESELDAYAPMEIEPYNFELKLDMPAQTDNDDDDDMLTDNNGLLSSFEIVSGDDDISVDNVDTGDLLVEETPAANDIADLLAEEPVVTSAPKADTAPVADDFSDLLAEEPAPAHTAKAEPAPAADDFSDLLAEEPAPAPTAKAEPAPAADDFSDLLAEEPAPAPVAKTERTSDRSGDKPKEKLNESRSMGVAGKEEKVNDPWKDLEAQMNGMTITPPPSSKPSDDDGMTSSFDDPTAPAASAKEEKIDMSDYSSMLGGINDNMTTNTAQYDPSWDLKMMEGLNDNDDDDDEMSSDNVGFFDL
ncbi:uncharacterized protein BN788_02216 [[Eubacterium] siraeum CAG:80]|uniref:Uncharacterized protein n=1 Tax=[Eubacterium] siraeum CAG:80 TaxID=1263080 RepID=R6RPN6_9FIRM|nr:uncharacterized protein BN788_02216 [[Eubacterium] siraeum CAG:80]